MPLQEAKKKVDFNSEPTLYDIEFDADLIEKSITAQYGVLPYAQSCLPYKDWAALVSGLMPESLLGRVIGIRAEQDKSVIEQMSPHQLKIRREWQRFLNGYQLKNEEQTRQELENLQQALKQMYLAGGEEYDRK